MLEGRYNTKIEREMEKSEWVISCFDFFIPVNKSKIPNPIFNFTCLPRSN